MSNKFLLRAFSLLLITFSFSCTRTDLQTIIIGGDLIDDQTKMCYVDTLEIEILNMHIDSIATKNSNYLLAGYVDEGTQIGKTSTSSYTQLSIGSEEGLNFEDRTLDSISFSIALEKESIYGDTSKYITLEVYEITEDIIGDSTLYFAEDTVKTDAVVLGSRTFKPSDVTSDTVKIQLDNKFGQKIIENAEYADQEDFASKIKGLALKVKRGNESAWCGKYSLENFGTVVTMNMHYLTDDSDQDTVRTQYYLGFSQRFNNITYEPGTLTSGINVGDVIDSEQTNNKGFVFEGTGLVASLKFPEVRNLFVKAPGTFSGDDSLREVHINKADLIITPIGVEDAEGKIFPADNTPPPALLNFGFKDENGEIIRLSETNRNYRYLQSQYPSSGDHSISYSGNTQTYTSAKLATYLQERSINQYYGLPLQDDGLVILPSQQNQNVRKLIFADDKSQMLHPLNGQTMRMRLVVYYAVFNDPFFDCK